MGLMDSERELPRALAETILTLNSMLYRQRTALWPVIALNTKRRHGGVEINDFLQTLCWACDCGPLVFRKPCDITRLMAGMPNMSDAHAKTRTPRLLVAIHEAERLTEEEQIAFTQSALAIRKHLLVVLIVNTDPGHLCTDKRWIETFRRDVTTIRWPDATEVTKKGTARLVRDEGDLYIPRSSREPLLIPVGNKIERFSAPPPSPTKDD